MACITGPLAPALVELFQTRARSSGVALAYNISIALFGGICLVLITALMEKTGNLAAPAWIMIGTGLLSFITTLCTRFHEKKELQSS